MTEPRAVVLCNGLNGLGAVRSLGSTGMPVTTVFPGPGEPAWSSRYATARHIIARQASDETWRAFLLEHARNAVVIPTSDPGVGVLSRLRPTLPDDVRVVAPPDTVGEMLVDKRTELERIRRCGVPVPRSLLQLPANSSQFVEQLPLPVIIKPVLLADSAIIGAKNLQASTPAELERAYARMQGRHDRFIAQEIVPGDDTHLWVCNATFDTSHRLVAAFTFQRLRTSPAHYGVTSSAVSRRNPEVLERVAALGQELGYVGPAMFEFKQHPTNGEYLYIEINPRIGMCNWFDTRCGVNNVLAAYQVAAYGTVEKPMLDQGDGKVFLDLYSDFYSRLADGESLQGVARDYLGHLRSERVAAYFLGSDLSPGINALRRNIVTAFGVAIGMLRRPRRH
jgi:predicted ATP-grasp superfamily ATP-dependent carboligase